MFRDESLLHPLLYSEALPYRRIRCSNTYQLHRCELPKVGPGKFSTLSRQDDRIIIHLFNSKWSTEPQWTYLSLNQIQFCVNVLILRHELFYESAPFSAVRNHMRVSVSVNDFSSKNSWFSHMCSQIFIGSRVIWSGEFAANIIIVNICLQIDC